MSNWKPAIEHAEDYFRKTVTALADTVMDEIEAAAGDPIDIQSTIWETVDSSEASIYNGANLAVIAGAPFETAAEAFHYVGATYHDKTTPQAVAFQILLWSVGEEVRRRLKEPNS